MGIAREFPFFLDFLQKVWKVAKNVVMSGLANEIARMIKAGMWDGLGVSGVSDIWLPLLIGAGGDWEF
jgi:hypothetical protein